MHKHEWAKVGVNLSGVVISPCRFKDCDKALGLKQDGSYEIMLWPTAIDGITLDLIDSSESGVSKFICKEFEILSVPFVNKISLKPGDVIVDIGAHIGAPSIYLAKRYPLTKIFSLEPSPVNYQNLVRNIRVNEADNIKSFNIGVTKDGRKIEMGYGLDESCNTSEFIKSDKTICAITMNLSEFFNLSKIEKCRLLKMDCEGAEHEIIMSNPELFDRVEYFSGEFHINGMLAGMGYNIERTYDTLCKHIKPENMQISGLRGENGPLLDIKKVNQN